MKNKIALQGLAMDLKRASLLLHQKSYIAARRFTQEALRRKDEIDRSQLKLYMQKVLPKVEVALDNKQPEDILMYATIIQNYSLTL